ncbi:hypothetical protein D9615_009363 [Tricholomella constricta]|uniref:EthD domain-containing protein n=1 Tax=Tricholomella constricta TaxID=117010 RepID=A0A8H5H2E7_9AGAR|nr:hypothetical protein D9615_009363 [Tricholomella constricta]
MPAVEVADGLLFVYGERGPDVTEEEYNNWYDKEHAPARIALPGFSSAARYKALDGKPPSWLALYDTSTPEYLQSDEYKALSINAPAGEKSIISRLVTLNRRIYSRFSTLEKPGFDAAAVLPAKVVLVVGLQPASQEKEEDMNKWYAEEHLDLIAKVPGFLRARRYKLVSQIELAGKADANSPVAAFPYVTLYDLETDAFLTDPALKEAVTTPWSVKVLGEIASSEMRPFALHSSFTK